MLTSAQSAEERTAIYEALLRRNRVVRILRVGLPMLGGIVLAGLLLQLMVASVLGQFGISNVKIDRNNLVVETPSYSSMTADGTMVTVQSLAARTALGDTDLLHLENAELHVTKPTGLWMHAAATMAEMRLSTQGVFVPGDMAISDSRGTTGTIRQVRANLVGEGMESDGNAVIRYHNGMVIEAERMRYSGKTGQWVFEQATLTVPATARQKARATALAAEDEAQ